MKTKIELIDRAYSKLRISGITFSPTPSDVALAVDELESMMAEWDASNVCVGYNFEEGLSSNSDSNVPKFAENAVQTNLAVRLSPDFGKEVPMVLMMQATQSYSRLSSHVAKVKETPYPSRQPIGEANTLRFNRWNRFYNVTVDAPSDCDTQISSVGDISDVNVSYTDYLKGDDTIQSISFASSAGLEVLSDSFDDNSVTFRIKSLKVGTQKIDLEVTTANGLVDNKCLWFSISDC